MYHVTIVSFANVIFLTLTIMELPPVLPDESACTACGSVDLRVRTPALKSQTLIDFQKKLPVAYIFLELSLLHIV
jgi:hypothetical protein